MGNLNFIFAFRYFSIPSFNIPLYFSSRYNFNIVSMKSIFLMGIILCLHVSITYSQTPVRTIIPANSIKSQHPSSDINTPDNNDSKINEDGTERKSQTQFLEYRSNENSSIPNVENQENEPLIIFPIVAQGYTDPNYELNKQRSLEVTQQLEASEAPQKTNEELILDLQNKIKAIKDGVITDPIAINKLSYYEEELQVLLLNQKSE